MFEIAVEKFLQWKSRCHWQGDFCNNVDAIELCIGEFGWVSMHLNKHHLVKKGRTVYSMPRRANAGWVVLELLVHYIQTADYPSLDPVEAGTWIEHKVRDSYFQTTGIRSSHGVKEKPDGSYDRLVPPADKRSTEWLDWKKSERVACGVLMATPGEIDTEIILRNKGKPYDI
jgi:hypothetical protein